MRRSAPQVVIGGSFPSKADLLRVSDRFGMHPSRLRLVVILQRTSVGAVRQRCEDLSLIDYRFVSGGEAAFLTTLALRESCMSLHCPFTLIQIVWLPLWVIAIGVSWSSSPRDR